MSKKLITKTLPVLLAVGAFNLAAATQPVAAAPTFSGAAANRATGPTVYWVNEALKEGNKGLVAGAVGGALACAAGAPGALAGAVVGGGAGYIGGVLAYALFGVVGPIRTTSIPETALD